MLARPIKDGVDYFPLDTGFFIDDKVRLLRAQFGAKGMYALFYILCELYAKNGYFMKWDKNKCYLVSDGAGCGCDPGFLAELINGCVRCSFFDERVFNGFGVLTSAGIQRRFLRMLKNRDEIEIIKEYWLLDLSSKKDVPPGVLNKLTLKSFKSSENPDKSSENPDKSSENPQSKVNESKVNESKNTSCSEQNKSAHEPITFLPLSDGTYYAVYQKDIDLWKDTYPKVSVFLELKKMISWFDANPKKKKTKQGIRRCINGWMARCQEKGGSSDYSPSLSNTVDYTDAERYAGEKEGDPNEF